MASFQITWQRIKAGKIVATNGYSCQANSIMEAKGKFHACHVPHGDEKYKIVSCVKH